MIDRKNLKLFVIVSLVAAFFLVTAGWFTGFRHIAHGLMLTISIAAFLPFIIILAGITLMILSVVLPALLLCLGIVGTLLGGDVGGIEDASGVASDGVNAGHDAIDFGASFAEPYYQFLARQRHPVFWGVICGGILGMAILWAVIGIWIIPGETRTVTALLETRENIENYYKKEGSFPKPDQAQHLTPSLLSIGADASPILDGFGRPLLYRTTGKWKLASYTLTSYGFDGKQGGDDLCVSGSTKLMQLADATRQLFELFSAKDPKKNKLKTKFMGIKALRCEEGTERRKETD